MARSQDAGSTPTASDPGSPKQPGGRDVVSSGSEGLSALPGGRRANSAVTTDCVQVTDTPSLSETLPGNSAAVPTRAGMMQEAKFNFNESSLGWGEEGGRRSLGCGSDGGPATREAGRTSLQPRASLGEGRPCLLLA